MRFQYILTVHCVNDDVIQVAINDIADIFMWLKRVDHEGSSWTVIRHGWDGPIDDVHAQITETEDVTDIVRAGYEETDAV